MSVLDLACDVMSLERLFGAFSKHLPECFNTGVTAAYFKGTLAVPAHLVQLFMKYSKAFTLTCLPNREHLPEVRLQGHALIPIARGGVVQDEGPNPSRPHRQLHVPGRG